MVQCSWGGGASLVPSIWWVYLFFFLHPAPDQRLLGATLSQPAIFECVAWGMGLPSSIGTESGHWCWSFVPNQNLLNVIFVKNWNLSHSAACNLFFQCGTCSPEPRSVSRRVPTEGIRTGICVWEIAFKHLNCIGLIWFHNTPTDALFGAWKTWQRTNCHASWCWPQTVQTRLLLGRRYLHHFDLFFNTCSLQFLSHFRRSGKVCHPTFAWPCSCTPCSEAGAPEVKTSRSMEFCPRSSHLRAGWNDFPWEQHGNPSSCYDYRRFNENCWVQGRKARHLGSDRLQYRQRVEKWFLPPISSESDTSQTTEVFALHLNFVFVYT